MKWRTEESPRPIDSPIVVRDTDDHDHQLILTWRWMRDVGQWEADGFVKGGRELGASVVQPIDISDEIQACRIEWLPLREYLGDA